VCLRKGREREVNEKTSGWRDPVGVTGLTREPPENVPSTNPKSKKRVADVARRIRAVEAGTAEKKGSFAGKKRECKGHAEKRKETKKVGNQTKNKQIGN